MTPTREQVMEAISRLTPVADVATVADAVMRLLEPPKPAPPRKFIVVECPEDDCEGSIQPFSSEAKTDIPIPIRVVRELQVPSMDALMALFELQEGHAYRESWIRERLPAVIAACGLEVGKP